MTILYIFCGHRVWSSSRIFSSMRQSGSKATDLGWEEHNMHYPAVSIVCLCLCLPVYLVCFIQPSPTPNPSNKTSLPNLHCILFFVSAVSWSCPVSSCLPPLYLSVHPIYIHLYPSRYIHLYPSISRPLYRTIPYKILQVPNTACMTYKFKAKPGNKPWRVLWNYIKLVPYCNWMPRFSSTAAATA